MMTLFCECNSKWIFSTKADESEQIMRSESPFLEDIECPECCFYKWYNPQHENMMHDLKEMNS